MRQLLRSLGVTGAMGLALAIPSVAHGANADIAGTAIACSTDVVEPAGSYTCTVDYANLGPGAIVADDGHRIVIFDSGFSDVTKVSSPTGVCGLDGASPHCDFAAIAPGETVQMTATLKAGENAVGFNDEAIFESLESTDPNHANDRLSAIVKIREQVAPDTSLTRNYKKLTQKKLKRAKWGLKSTVAGSTFECRIDKKAFEPCTSPVKAKKFKSLKKPGKHRFCARAIAPNGMRDATPACDRFKVKRRRK
jgi:hypothetical protein